MPGRPSRRSVLATMAALPLAGALGACSGGTSGADSTSRTSTVSDKSGRNATHVTFWSALRGIQEVVDAFNRTHDTIQVDFQQIPAGGQGGYAKLSNASRAGNAPDIAAIEYPQVPGFAIDGVSLELTDMMSDGLRSELLPQALGLTTFDKRVFSVPLDVEPMVMHYRTDLFAEYGIEVPRTRAAFEEAARTVRANAPGRRLVAFATDGEPHFAVFARQAGAQWFDTGGGAWNVSLTDEPTRRVAAYWQRMIDQDLVFPTPVDSRRFDSRVSNGKGASGSRSSPRAPSSSTPRTTFPPPYHSRPPDQEKDDRHLPLPACRGATAARRRRHAAGYRGRPAERPFAGRALSGV